MTFLRHVIRFIVSAIVLLVISWVVPQFTIGGFGSALFFALIIAIVGWIVEGIFGQKVTPFGRGVVGFFTSAVVIWISQFLVGGVEVGIFGAILGALAIGIVDLFIPISTPFKTIRSKD